MPAWSAKGTTNLASGYKLAVLLAESIAAGVPTQGFTFSPQPTPICLAIWNNSGQNVVLDASPDNVTWVACASAGVAIQVDTNVCSAFIVAGGLYYRISSASDITDGTIWVARS